MDAEQNLLESGWMRSQKNETPSISVLHRRCAWTGFWTFWIRTLAASNTIRSIVFSTVAGSGWI